MQTRFDKAVALNKAGRLEDAIREFRLIAEETTDDNWKAASLLNEACCCNDLDDADHVLKEIEKLATSDEIKMNVARVAAMFSSERGQHNKAALQFGDLLQEFAHVLSTPEYRDTHEEVCLRRSIELAYSDEHKQAVSLLEKAVTFSTLTDENRQRAHLWLGICYAELREDELAIREFLHVIAFNLFNGAEADARYRVAHLYSTRREFIKAKHQLETILLDNKEVSLLSTLTAEDRQRVHLLLGICHVEMSQGDLAVQQFQRAIAFNLINDNEAQTRYRLAHACFLRGGFAQAKSQLEAVLHDYKEVCRTIPLNHVYVLLSRACGYLGERENSKHYSSMARNSNDD